MLRGLVLLLVLLNAALFFWIREDPRWLQADREPQRLERQVSPNMIQVLPDLPRPGGSAPAADDAASGAASGQGARGPAADATLARKTSVELACAESEPLTPAQWTTLSLALARAGVPASAIGERRQPDRWMVYMGRYPDEAQWQHKADELRRLNLKFDRVSAPPGLDPGLSLGNFTSAEEAAARLDELGRHGVHTARVVEASGAGLRRLQVRAADDRWRASTAGQRFSACPPASSASL